MVLLRSQAPPVNGWPLIATEQRDPFAPTGFPAIIATTSRSAPVPCIGTCTLTKTLCLGSSLRIRTTGSHVPYECLLQDHAAFMPSAAQSVDRLPLGSSRAYHPARFRRHDIPHDTSSTVHFRSSSWTTPDAVEPRLFLRCSPPGLLTQAARSGLEPEPAPRFRGAFPHHPYSTACPPSFRS